jgi:hypothetical protein
MALTISEAFSPPYDVRILATDLSTKTLLRAKQASYEEQQVQGIRPDFLTRFFSSTNTEDSPARVVKAFSGIASTFSSSFVEIVPLAIAGQLDDLLPDPSPDFCGGKFSTAFFFAAFFFLRFFP